MDGRRSRDGEREEVERYLAVARSAAARVSADEQVIGEAADHAVAQFVTHKEGISTGERERRAWVEVTAQNHARRAGARLHRKLAMGRSGSEPPPMPDAPPGLSLQQLVGGMRSEHGSLGSDVAMKVEFEKRWALLSEEVRALLHARHVEGLTLKEIAERRGLGESTSRIDYRLRSARLAAGAVFADLLDGPDRS